MASANESSDTICESITMNMREAKALEIAARMRVEFKDGTWHVPSQSGQGTYRVTLKPGDNACTCDDWTLRKIDCKHVRAAQLVQERDHGGLAPAIDTTTIPKRPTYKQDWKNYNLAQTTEKHRFRALLSDLCRNVQEPESKGGRPRTPIADVLFACVFKVYSTVSSRRFTCDLVDAEKAGFIGYAIPFAKINHYMESEELTPILTDLIIRSSLPLAAVETSFAADSSGFSTSRFVRWFDEKYGVTRSGHDWVKAHIVCGVKTNIVTAVRIEGRDAGDAPQFKPMLETTRAHFETKEVRGDKAYSSVENIEAVFAAGGFPYVPFKSNATGGAGGLYQKLFCFYQLFRDEFLAHYHKRSNVESTFSMVKAKFRDHVRSRTDTAMVNEVLCKFLCHNVCVVIQSQCELGIEGRFWEAETVEEDGEVVSIPMIRKVMI